MSADGPEAQGKTRKASNVWALTAGHNPYLHNIFALLGIDPDEGERIFTQRCKVVEGRLQGRKEIVVHGRKVVEADVARATYLTQNQEEYVAERLLAHTAHKVDLKAFQEPMAAIEAIAFDPPAKVLPLPIHDVSFLVRLLPEPAQMVAGEIKPLDQAQWESLARPDPAEERAVDA